jgi:ribosomal protein S18 acetylase RimI-like enzyme
MVTLCQPDIVALERACLTAVPAQRVAFDGSFVVRGFLGGTGRANAASSLSAEADTELSARIARIENCYGALRLPVRFRSTPLDPPGMAEQLTARGYVTKDETIIFLAPIQGVAHADVCMRVLSAPDEDWMAVTATAKHQVPARRAEKERAVSMMMVPGAWLVLYEDAKPMACISVVADGPLAGFFDLAVVPEARRRGFGSRITRAAASWAAERGAIWLWAQVAAANQASCAAQQSLGMREAYRYVYFVMPQDKVAALHFG